MRLHRTVSILGFSMLCSSLRAIIFLIDSFNSHYFDNTVSFAACVSTRDRYLDFPAKLSQIRQKISFVLKFWLDFNIRLSPEVEYTSILVAYAPEVQFSIYVCLKIKNIRIYCTIFIHQKFTGCMKKEYLHFDKCFQCGLRVIINHAFEHS